MEETPHGHVEKMWNCHLNKYSSNANESSAYDIFIFLGSILTEDEWSNEYLTSVFFFFLQKMFWWTITTTSTTLRLTVRRANPQINTPGDPGLPERCQMTRRSKTSRYPSYTRCAAQALDECPPTEKYIKGNMTPLPGAVERRYASRSGVNKQVRNITARADTKFSCHGGLRVTGQALMRTKLGQDLNWNQFYSSFQMGNNNGRHLDTTKPTAS